MLRIKERVAKFFLSDLFNNAVEWVADILIILLNLRIRRKEVAMNLMEDFDRGMVQMKCYGKETCSYRLPHYHCEICGYQVNSDELRRDYHPCCSLECIKIYNERFD